MSITHEIKTVYSYQGTNVTTESAIITDSQIAGNFIEINESIADSTTDGLVALTVDVSQMKLLFMTSTEIVTVETNSSSVPDDTFTVGPTTPVIWGNGGIHTNPLTADVTALYITNTSGSAATFRVKILVDPTV